MTYTLLADLVVALHLGFLAFVALGGFLIRRHRWVLPVHLAAVAWGAGIVTAGWACPLTVVERWLRERGGGSVSGQGFIDHYLTGVVYPHGWEWQARAVVAGLVVWSYVRYLSSLHSHSPSANLD